MLETRQRTSILFIDDDAMDLRIYRFFTSMNAPTSIDAVYAQSVSDAVRQLQSTSFDLVLIDHRMPPFHDYRETADTLAPFLGEAVVYMISGLSKDKLPAREMHPRVSGLLDKHEMRDIFIEGFVERLIDAADISMGEIASRL